MFRRILISFIIFQLCCAKKRKRSGFIPDMDGSKIVLRSDNGILNMKVFEIFSGVKLQLLTGFITNKVCTLKQLKDCEPE